MHGSNNNNNNIIILNNRVMADTRPPPPSTPPPSLLKNATTTTDKTLKHAPVHLVHPVHPATPAAPPVPQQQRFTFDPYNPQNVMITQTEVVCLLKTYGFQDNFRLQNFNLFKRAFVHRSYVRRPAQENVRNGVFLAAKPDECLGLFKKSNERLEFIGDGLLELITKFYLYRRFPKENEGFMTEKKIALVKNEAIGQIALEMGLHKWFIISKHAEQKQTRTNLRKLGCLFEAFLGALFLECNKIAVRDEDALFHDVFLCGPGFQMVQIFVESVFEKHVNWMNLIHDDDNYKNILQVIIQKEFKVTPEYAEGRDGSFRVGSTLRIHMGSDDPTIRGGGGGDDEFHMGVFLVVGYTTLDLQQTLSNALLPLRTMDEFSSLRDVHASRKIILLLGKASHKNKKKAEQLACKDALDKMGSWNRGTG